jgi:superfamily II DNA or RNA helicase
VAEPIRAVLGNRTSRLIPPYPFDLLDKLTSYAIPGVYFMPQFNRWHEVEKVIDGEKRLVQERVWDGKCHLLNKKTHTLPTGLLLSLQKDLVQQGFLVHTDRSLRKCPSVWLEKEGKDQSALRYFVKGKFPGAREYQIEALLAMLRNCPSGGLILQATGSGKTRLAAMLFSVLFDVKCLFVVDELTLLYQAQKEIVETIHERVGVVGESRFKVERVSVATIQTLDLHKNDPIFRKWLDSVGVMVLDELHVQMARRNFSVVEKLQPPAVYGLTATLELKKKHVRLRAYSLCGPVLYEYPASEGIKDKFLVKACIVRVSVPREVELVRGGSRTMEYMRNYKKIVSHSKNRNDVVEALARAAVGDGRRVIVLVEWVKHLKILGKRLADLRPALIWGGVGSTERRKAQKSFEKDQLRLAIVNKVFQKGINIKKIDCGIDASAMRSANQAIQKLGRFLRTCDGKGYALYFDISDEQNRFEKAAKRRASAFRKAGFPMIRVQAPLEGDAKEWYRRVVKKVELVLKIEGQDGGVN